jgi:hypothetical protein
MIKVFKDICKGNTPTFKLVILTCDIDFREVEVVINKVRGTFVLRIPFDVSLFSNVN